MNKILRGFTIYTLLALFYTVSLSGQHIDNSASYRDVKSDSYFRFQYDNDFFTATDYYYTQGYSFELVKPCLIHNPVNKLFPGLQNSQSRYGLAFEQSGFTPTDITDDKIRYGDRPFAATIALKSFKMDTDTVNKSRLASSLTMGMVGPAALGNEMQTGIHKWIDDDIPMGWQYQIKNDVILDYEVNYEKQLFRLDNYFALTANTKLRLGTLNTNASAGFTITAGLINNPFKSFTNKNNFRIYAYTQPSASVVGYNATLQGGLFNRKSAYTITSSNVERFILTNNFGLVVQFRGFYAEYSRSVITREFAAGSSHAWGGFRVGFTI